MRETLVKTRSIRRTTWLACRNKDFARLTQNEITKRSFQLTTDLTLNEFDLSVISTDRWSPEFNPCRTEIRLFFFFRLSKEFCSRDTRTTSRHFLLDRETHLTNGNYVVLISFFSDELCWIHFGVVRAESWMFNEWRMLSESRRIDVNRRVLLVVLNFGRSN